MTDKFGNLLSPDRNNETEESKCCKQLGSEVLTLKIFSEFIERMVSLGFDSDGKLKQKLDWLQTRKNQRDKKFQMCAYFQMCKVAIC